MPPDTFAPQHAAECPALLGVRPIWRDDLGTHGLRCAECGALFRIGDQYTGLALAGAPDVFEVVCLGCAAIGVVSR